MSLFFIIVVIGIICLIPVVLPIVIVVKVVKHINRKRAENSGESDFIEKPEKKRKEKIKLNSSTVMLLIGTAFISLSGVAFGVAGWVNTTPAGRILIMMLATAISFGISVLFRKVFKLENTSTAFYTIGSFLTSATIITAGWFEVFGNWFSTFGDGKYLLYSFSAVCISVLMFFAFRIYNKPAFEYTGLSAVSVILVFIALQIANGTFKYFAVVIAIFQIIITACMNFVRDIRKSVQIVGTVTSIYFGIISLSYSVTRTFAPTSESYIIFSIMFVQLLFYGIYFDKKWCIVFQNIVSLFIAFSIASDFGSRYNDDRAVFVFGLCTLIIYTANKFIPQLKNLFTELLSLGAIIFSSITLIEEIHIDNPNYSLLIIPVFVSLILLSYTFHEKKAFQVLAGLASPVIPFTMAEELDRIVFPDMEEMAFVILGLVFSAANLLIVYLPKYAFKFHANHPRKTNTILNVNAIATALIILGISYDFYDMVLVSVILCAVHFFTASKLRNNFTSVVSIIGMAIMINDKLDEICRLDKITCETQSWILGGIAGLLMIASKFIHPISVCKRNENGIKFDTILFGSIAFTVLADRDFICMMLSALFTACLVKKNTKQITSSVLLSISAVLTAIAMFNRDFALSNSQIVTHKINIGILVLMGVAYKYIWKHNRSFSKISSTIIFILSFASLLWDCLWYATMGNTIFTLCVTAGIFVLSFMTKSKTWFSVSSVAVFIITVHATHKYFGSVQWWAYLFIAGIVFIGLAGVNEYFKTKGETAKSALARVFSDWNW